MATNTLCTFYIVRHGETDWNAQKRIQGLTDIPLNAAGQIQAKELADTLRHIHFDKVFSSDLKRAHETAQLMTLEKEIAIEMTKLLREKKFGPYEGESVTTLDTIDALMDNLTQKEKFSFKPHEDVESDEEVIGRFITFLREAAVAYPGKTILVVTHGGTMRTLLIHLGVLSHKNTRGAIKNTAYIHLESDGIDFFVKETIGITLPTQSTH